MSDNFTNINCESCGADLALRKANPQLNVVLQHTQ